MYKITTKRLEDLKSALIKSTNELKKIEAEKGYAPTLTAAIRANESQIEMLNEEYYLS